MYLILLSGKYKDIPLFLVPSYYEIEQSYLPKIFSGVIFPKPKNDILCIEAHEPQSPEERDNLVLENLSDLLSLQISDREKWNFLYVVPFNANGIDSLDSDTWKVLYTFNQRGQSSHRQSKTNRGFPII